MDAVVGTEWLWFGAGSDLSSESSVWVEGDDVVG